MESQESRKRRLSRQRQQRKRARMHDGVKEDVQEANLHAYFEQMLRLKYTCGTSDKAIIEAHGIIFHMVEKLMTLKEHGLLPKSGKKILEHGQNLVPQLKTDVIVKTENGDTRKHANLLQIPKRLLSSGDIIREVSYVPVKALLQHIRGIHGNDFFAHGVKAILSVDGVPESHSGSTTLRVILFLDVFFP